jgi:hypothetical protein
MFDRKNEGPGGAAGACMEDQQSVSGQPYTPAPPATQGVYRGRWRTSDSRFRPPPGDEPGDDAQWFQNHPDRRCRLRRLRPADFEASAAQNVLPMLLLTQIDGHLIGVVIPPHGLPDADDDGALRERFLQAIDDSAELRALVQDVLAEAKP